MKEVIYLDAAYDRTNVTSLMSYWPAFRNPTAKDSSSMDNFKAYWANAMGVTMPDEEMKSIIVFSKDGKYQKDVTSEEIQGQILSGVERPNYKSINCPALSVYANASNIYTIVPFYDSLDAENKNKANTFFTIYKNWANEQMELFKKEVKKGIVKELKGANHYVFISNPVETENLIREFLK